MEQMESRELMVGDWIYGDNGPCRVAEILNNFGFLSVKGYADGIRRFTKVVEPVPLTAEMLKINSAAWLGLDTCCISLDINSIFYCREIRYVHELQHALRLCGQKEMADNFKIE